MDQWLPGYLGGRQLSGLRSWPWCISHVPLRDVVVKEERPLLGQRTSSLESTRAFKNGDCPSSVPQDSDFMGLGYCLGTRVFESSVVILTCSWDWKPLL